MKKVVSLSVILLLASFCLLLNAQSAQGKSDQWNKRAAKKWLRKKEWLSGWNSQPHKSLNVQEFARQYHANKPYWDKAFAFLAEHDLNNLPVGKYPIDGDHVFASVTFSQTKSFDSTQWESHRKYIDLQYVIEGEEKMGVNPVSKSTVTKSYNETKDVANYSVKGKIYNATPDHFFIFFPTDAHRPNITPGGYKPDKKIVIKIKSVE